MDFWSRPRIRSNSVGSEDRPAMLLTGDSAVAPSPSSEGDPRHCKRVRFADRIVTGVLEYESVAVPEEDSAEPAAENSGGSHITASIYNLTRSLALLQIPSRLKSRFYRNRTSTNAAAGGASTEVHSPHPRSEGSSEDGELAVTSVDGSDVAEQTPVSSTGSPSPVLAYLSKVFGNVRNAVGNAFFASDQPALDS